MNYEVASVENIVAHFGTISRQRIHQILKKYQDADDAEIVAKIQRAKALLKSRKYIRKIGCTQAQRRNCNTIWRLLNMRVGKHPAYLDCTVGFASNVAFREWALVQIGYGQPGFELDKDVLIKGNRVYGPDTCVFLPQEVNVLLSGCYRAKHRGKYPIGVCFNKGSKTFVAQMNDRQGRGLDKYLGSFPTVEEAFACYKTAKEARIKALADKWRDQIDPRAYDALVARTVEWED